VRELLREFQNVEAAALLVQWLAVPVGVGLAALDHLYVGLAVVVGGTAFRMLVFNLSRSFRQSKRQPLS
jgi:hypothetical protein